MSWGDNINDNSDKVFIWIVVILFAFALLYRIFAGDGRTDEERYLDGRCDAEQSYASRHGTKLSDMCSEYLKMKQEEERLEKEYQQNQPDLNFRGQ